MSKTSKLRSDILQINRSLNTSYSDSKPDFACNEQNVYVKVGHFSFKPSSHDRITFAPFSHEQSNIMSWATPSTQTSETPSNFPVSLRPSASYYKQKSTAINLDTCLKLIETKKLHGDCGNRKIK